VAGRKIMNREHLVTELAALLEVNPGTLREDEQVRNLEHWDSLKLLEVIALADEQLHVQIDADRLVQCVTVGDILKLLQDSAMAKGPSS
jgi:acyl carrier protein